MGFTSSNSMSSSMVSPQAKTQTTSISTSSTRPPNDQYFDDWAHALLVAVLLLLVIIFTVLLIKYCRRKISRASTCTPSYIVEVRSDSPTSTPGQNEVQNSPLYYEADTFQFSSKEPKVIEPTDVESNSKDENCCPENIEYETMNPPQASAEYVYAYGHVNINAGYMNTPLSRKRPTNGVEDDYEYPQNRRSSSDNEYRYAYDWLDPDARVAALSANEPVLASHGKDKVDDNDTVCENDETLSGERLGNSPEPVPLQYVTVVKNVELL
ncbi:Hypothetical predicted protein [Paramuricea clavata]|uniref:Uncharacterized protein n=1 Tax=Paramuricea clavata TaxID=317549 RepID=A0A6S7IC73_PARCT|nr:Hypothetical predicted protein [Paramuricea clavata]